MSIPHAEARRLIQFQIDGALNSEHKARLAAHLKECSACRGYAEEIQDVTRMLTPLMQRQWGRRPLPLSTAALRGKTSPHSGTGAVLAMRTAFVAFAFLAFAAGARQFMLASTGIPRQPPVSAVPVSTPSIQSTTTLSGPESCEMILYTVRPTDTLASIARQFSLTQADILAANKLKRLPLRPGMRLLIPGCTFTPTSPVEAPLLLPTIYTPLFDPPATTPGPGG